MLLDLKCPFGLRNFIFGVGVLDPNTMKLWRDIDLNFPTIRSSIGSPSKACLNTAFRGEAFELLLCMLLDKNDIYPTKVVSSVLPFVAHVRGAIEAAHQGMLFDPHDSFTALFQYWSGYTTALSWFFPKDFIQELQSTEHFEEYLQRQYGYNAKWYILLRTFENTNIKYGYLGQWDKCHGPKKIQ